MAYNETAAVPAAMTAGQKLQNVAADFARLEGRLQTLADRLCGASKEAGSLERAERAPADGVFPGLEQLASAMQARIDRMDAAIGRIERAAE